MKHKLLCYVFGQEKGTPLAVLHFLEWLQISTEVLYFRVTETFQGFLQQVDDQNHKLLSQALNLTKDKKPLCHSLEIINPKGGGERDFKN